MVNPLRPANLYYFTTIAAKSDKNLHFRKGFIQIQTGFPPIFYFLVMTLLILLLVCLLVLAVAVAPLRTGFRNETTRSARGHPKQYPSIPYALYSSLVPVALIGALVYMASRKKRAAANVSYAMGLPSSIRFDLPTLSIVGRWKIVFDNASPQSFQVNALYLKLMQGNRNVGNIAKAAFTLPGAARTEVDCDFRIGLLSLGINLFQLIQTGILQTIDIDGYVNSAGFNLYINKQVNIQLPQVPEWVKALKVTAA